MTFDELKAYILSKMTMEEAFDRLLQSGLGSYQQLKFEQGKEVHPLLIMSMAAMEMGWGFMIDQSDEDVHGILTGDEDYLKRKAALL